MKADVELKQEDLLDLEREEGDPSPLDFTSIGLVWHRGRKKRTIMEGDITHEVFQYDPDNGEEENLESAQEQEVEDPFPGKLLFWALALGYQGKDKDYLDCWANGLDGAQIGRHLGRTKQAVYAALARIEKWAWAQFSSPGHSQRGAELVKEWRERRSAPPLPLSPLSPMRAPDRRGRKAKGGGVA